MTAISTSRALRRMLLAPRHEGASLGHGHLAFGGYVVSLTAPGQPRMPNGVEVDVQAPVGTPAAIGGGVLEVGTTLIVPGPEWDPIPHRLPAAGDPWPPDGLLEAAGLGPGLTPAADDVLAGYIAGLVLLHGRLREAENLAFRAALITTPLSATLLLHAARGEVPEPVHEFLATGDPARLIRMGQTSGRSWLRGLALAGAPVPGSATERPVAERYLS